MPHIFVSTTIQCRVTQNKIILTNEFFQPADSQVSCKPIFLTHSV